MTTGYDDIERYAKKAFIAGSSYGCDSSSIASDMWSMLDPLQVRSIHTHVLSCPIMSYYVSVEVNGWSL